MKYLGLFFCSFLFLSFYTEAQVPQKITYQGTFYYLDLHGKQKPLKAGGYLCTFKFFYDAAGTNLAYSEGDPVTIDKNGLYTITIGQNNPIDASIFVSPIWLGVTLTVGPKQAHVTFPYNIPANIAFTLVPFAGAANNVVGGTVNATSVTSTGDITSSGNIHAAGIVLSSNIIADGNITAGAITANGGAHIGANSPLIAVKKFTSTSPVTTGGNINITHGLTHSDILSISVLVQASNTYWMESHWTYSAGYEFGWYENQGQIHIDFKNGNDGNLLGQPVQVLITYIQP